MLFLTQSSARFFYCEGNWSQSFPVCSSNSLEFYSTKHQAITIYLLVLLNAFSKLIFFPFPASHVPHRATAAPLTRACLNLCAL